MFIRYSLSIDDHLAWYDYYLSTPAGSRVRPALPIIGSWLRRRRRERFARQMLATPLALGDRSLELSAAGIREFSDRLDFSIRWQDVGLVATTDHHLFIAHASMNAHIVPLSAFDSHTSQHAFLLFAQGHVTPTI